MNGDFGSLNNADREADERLLREKSLKMADSVLIPKSRA